jgi:hypothetical protein
MVYVGIVLVVVLVAAMAILAVGLLAYYYSL